MQFRVVRVTVAPGKSAEYWAWAKEIAALWDAHGVKRAGGPYRILAGGEEVALWLTVHDSAEDARAEFERMYGSGHGRELIEQRPPLVSATVSSLHDEWDLSADPPPAPSW